MCIRDSYEAYMVQATVLLDTVKCRNIQTEGATEANVGADKQLSYMKLPGQDVYKRQPQVCMKISCRENEKKTLTKVQG